MSDDTTDKFLADVMKKIEDKHRPPPGELTEPTKMLVADLEAARTAENAQAVNWILKRAKREHYHDFLSPLSTPCMELAKHLRLAGLVAMAEAAEGGKYDA